MLILKLCVRFLWNVNLGMHKSRAPGHQVTRFCIMVPDSSGSWLCNLLYVTILVCRILKCLLDFWKVCAPLS
jgi:hypothetical protein